MAEHGHRRPRAVARRRGCLAEQTQVPHGKGLDAVNKRLALAGRHGLGQLVHEADGQTGGAFQSLSWGLRVEPAEAHHPALELGLLGRGLSDAGQRPLTTRAGHVAAPAVSHARVGQAEALQSRHRSRGGRRGDVQSPRRSRALCSSTAFCELGRFSHFPDSVTTRKPRSGRWTTSSAAGAPQGNCGRRAAARATKPRRPATCASSSGR